MRYRHFLAAAILIPALVAQAGAQTSKTVSEIIVAPFVVETRDADLLRSQAASCFDQLVAALKRKGVVVARDPELTEKNLQSASALWAVLGRISREKELFQVELRLLEVKSGDEQRLYFNSDKDLQVACRVVDKAAERIAVFVAEAKAGP